MADNYLEKKMEDYLRSGSGSVRRSAPSRMRPGMVAVRYPSVRVLVSDGCSEPGRAMIKLLREMGCRVAFIDADPMAGNRLAQETGSQFHPGAAVDQVIERLVAAGDPVEAVISPCDCEHLLTFHGGGSVSRPAACTAPGDIAAFCAYAIHPSASWLRR